MADGITIQDIKAGVIDLITKVFDLVMLIIKVFKMFK